MTFQPWGVRSGKSIFWVKIGIRLFSSHSVCIKILLLVEYIINYSQKIISMEILRYYSYKYGCSHSAFQWKENLRTFLQYVTVVSISNPCKNLNVRARKGGQPTKTLHGPNLFKTNNYKFQTLMLVTIYYFIHKAYIHGRFLLHLCNCLTLSSLLILWVFFFL